VTASGIRHENLDFKSAVSTPPTEFLQAFQRDDLAVVQVDLGDTGLATLLCLAPADRYFGQEFWFGPSHLNWYLTFGLDAKNVARIADGVQRSGCKLADVPGYLLRFGSGKLAEIVDQQRSVDRNVLQSITIPRAAVDVGLRAIEASAPLVRAFLYLPVTHDLGVNARYGLAEIEKVFPRENYSYRLSPKLRNAVAGFRRPLDESAALRALQTVAELADKMLHSDQRALRPNWRWLTYRPIDCRDHDERQRELVVEINRDRAVLVQKLGLPHFYYELILRRVDVSLNKKLSAYPTMPNDRDWMLTLHATAPASFSAGFEELTLIDRYLADMRARYPCLQQDAFERALTTSVRST